MRPHEEKQAALTGYLYRTVLDEKGNDLTEEQSAIFLQACKKVVIENLGSGFETMQNTAEAYLKLILENPRVNLQEHSIHVAS